MMIKKSLFSLFIFCSLAMLSAHSSNFPVQILAQDLTAESPLLTANQESRAEQQISAEETNGLRTKIIERVSKVFSPEVSVFIISMLPIFELRGAIPVGINHFRLNPLLVFLISITGNMVPVFFILLFLDGITKVFYKIPLLRNLLEFIFQRTRSKSKAVEKYEELGLVAFVAIPLPITGAWTGSLAAYLFGLNFWKSLFFIFCGVVIAGIVVTTLSLLGWLGAIIALTVLLLLFLRKALNMMSNKKRKLELKQSEDIS
jgi:uncharacterized membrane protein